MLINSCLLNHIWYFFLIDNDPSLYEPVEGAEGRREGMKHTQQVFGPSVEQQRI